MANIKVKLLSKGIEEFLESTEMADAIKDVAEDVKSQVSGLHGEEEEWQIEKSKRRDRVIMNVSNNNEDIKWQEMEDSKIASMLGTRN